MNNINVDVAIIGAGTAGLNARREVERAGKRSVLIESGPYGTTCARVGCMPSKLLIAAADVAHEITGANRFGIAVKDAWRIDGQAVMDRVRRERDRFAGFVVKSTEALPEGQRLRGHARFVDDTTLEVDNDFRVHANAVVIATGSSAIVPRPLDNIHRHRLISDDVFELHDLPQSVGVVGAGIIGLELGQALARLGVRVSIFNLDDSVGPFTDPALKRYAGKTFSTEFPLYLESAIVDARENSEGVTLTWRDADSAEHQDQFSKVLVAAGRRPNTGALGLENTGVVLDQRGHPQWDPTTTQCGDRPVFLAGDASGHIPLLHEASDEGRIAGANAAAFPHIAAHDRRTPLAIAFTDPQIAIVGTPYGELAHDEIEIGEESFNDQGRARVMGQNRGLVRIYGGQKGCALLGAEMFGPRVEHMAHLLAWAVQQNMSVLRALEMPVYHPVVEEGLRTALRDLARKLEVSGRCRSEDLAEAPGA